MRSRPAPGVDVAGGQVDQRAVGLAVVLHEHQVPDLEVALGAAVQRPAARPRTRALVVVDLRARAAGAGASPISQKLSSPMRWMRSAGTPDLVPPDGLGLVVVDVDGDPQPVAVEPEHLGEQLPGQGDGLLLEVVAEAEVAQHLEEGEVAGGVADVLDVVVLALDGRTSAPTWPGGTGGGSSPRMYREELVHARVGEQRRRRVVRDEPGRRDERVAALDEEPGEGLPQLLGVHARHSLKARIDARLRPKPASPVPPLAQDDWRRPFSARSSASRSAHGLAALADRGPGVGQPPPHRIGEVLPQGGGGLARQHAGRLAPGELERGPADRVDDQVGDAVARQEGEGEDDRASDHEPDALPHAVRRGRSWRSTAGACKPAPGPGHAGAGGHHLDQRAADRVVGHPGGGVDGAGDGLDGGRGGCRPAPGRRRPAAPRRGRRPAAARRARWTSSTVRRTVASVREAASRTSTSPTAPMIVATATIRAATSTLIGHRSVVGLVARVAVAHALGDLLVRSRGRTARSRPARPPRVGGSSWGTHPRGSS